MDIDPRLIPGFVTVATEGSFTRAAERLGMTQPTLSLQMQRLEDSLGLFLFDRTTRSVNLTREGRALLARCQDIHEQLAALKLDVRRLHELNRRELNVGTAFQTIDIPERNEILEGFSLRSPEIRLTVHDAAQSQLVSALRRGRLDCAIVLGVATTEREYFAGTRAQGGEGLYPVEWRRVLIASKPICLLIPEEMEVAQATEVTPDMLAGVQVALIDPSQGPQVLEPLRAFLEAGGAEVVYPFESRHAIAVERFAARRRTPCISLGWFTGPGGSHAMGMVNRPLRGYDVSTDLVLLASSDPASAMTERLVAFADEWRTQPT